MLTKVRGLWRHDGDEGPVVVSRRSFLFMGGIVAAGLALPTNGVVDSIPVSEGVTTTFPIYDAATGLPMDRLLVVTEVDRVLGVITLESMTAEEYLRRPDPREFVAPEQPRLFDEMVPGAVVAKRDVLLADALDALHHPRDERRLTRGPRVAICTTPDRVEAWHRRLTGRRPGGGFA